MLARIKALLAAPGRKTPSDRADKSERDPLELAGAVLLVEAAAMDGSFDNDERAVVLALLSERFDLSPADAATLITEAEAEVAEATQLYGFIRVVNERLDEDEKAGVVEMLWQVAYADGHLHDYEAGLVRRVVGLLHVSDRAGGAARKRALAKLGIDPDEA